MYLIKLLRQPYPIIENKWKIIISISLFITLFMLLFQPFGLQAFRSQIKYVILTGYGFVTFCILVFNLIVLETVFSMLFKEENWTAGKQILWLIWILFTIGSGNFFFSQAVFMSIRMNFHAFFFFQLYTLTIGAIPILILTLYTQNYLLRRNIQSANQISGELKNHSAGERELTDNFILLADNRKDKLQIGMQNLLYIESEGNYVSIAWLDSGKIKKTLLRSTLKRIKEQIIHLPYLFQCHRAFIVNCKNITDVKGNAQGFRLRLLSCDSVIPVSRNYLHTFRRLMKKL